MLMARKIHVIHILTKVYAPFPAKNKNVVATSHRVTYARAAINEAHRSYRSLSFLVSSCGITF